MAQRLWVVVVAVLAIAAAPAAPSWIEVVAKARQLEDVYSGALSDIIGGTRADKGPIPGKETAELLKLAAGMRPLLEPLDHALAAPCRLPGDDSYNVMDGLKLSEQLLATAITNAVEKKPAAADLTLAMRWAGFLGRCGNSSLLGFMVAQAAEKRALSATAWLWNHGALSAAELKQVLRAQPRLGPDDLRRALADERANMLREIEGLRAVPDGRLFNPQRTRAYVDAGFARLDAAVGKGPRVFEVIQDDLGASIPSRDAKVRAALRRLQDVGYRLDGLSPDEQEALAAHDNVMGKSLMGASLVATARALGQAEQAFKDLASERAFLESQREPPPATPLAEAPAEDGGIKARCRAEQGRFVLTAADVVEVSAAWPEKLSQVARVVPAFQEGQVHGFKVFQIPPDSLPASCGLQDGDVVQQVNGLDLRGPNDLDAAQARVRQEGSARFIIKRNGVQVRLTVEAQK